MITDYRKQSIIIKKNNPLYSEIDNLCFKSKNLYNATLYSERQHYFNNQKFMFFYSINKKFISENNQDYRALPAKVSKQVQMSLNEVLTSFIKLKQKNLPAKFPKYLNKNSRYILRYEKGALSFKKKGFIKLSKTNIQIKNNIDKNQVQMVRLVPKNGYYVIEILYKIPIKDKQQDLKYASIDLGINNLATLTSPEFNPRIYNGKPLKSINQFANKKIAEHQSLLKNKQYTSNKIDYIRMKRDYKINDYLQKTAKELVNYLVSQTITTLIVGKNKGWKQNTNIGKKNNQNFNNIPFYKFENKLKYLCKENGINYYEQEESYTSKSSFLDNDDLPIYDKSQNKKYIFSGKRIKRGLYQTKDNKYINSDVNGSLNILKKFLISKDKWNQSIFTKIINNIDTIDKISIESNIFKQK